jgi:hypothetical protein
MRNVRRLNLAFRQEILFGLRDCRNFDLRFGSNPQ